jgi:o-succinylbenzoate---CoA ligase
LKVFLKHTVFEPGKYLDTANCTEAESYVIRFIAKWLAGESEFTFFTSGSTGVPKDIILRREQLLASANKTLHFLFGSNPIQNLLLCIPPDRIGGAMQIVRSLVSGADLHVLTPSSGVLNSLPDVHFDLASVVPLQLEQANPDFKKLNTVLIGGTSLNPKMENALLQKSSTRFFHTYGMTETASHVALRRIGTPHFHLLPGIEALPDARGCLKIRGDVTNHEWLQTNDLVNINPDGFSVVGRADWVINSGGIKISPESLESTLISELHEQSLLITSIPDERLGEQLVLMSKRPLLHLLPEKSVKWPSPLPKIEVLVEELPCLDSGKPDRAAARQLALKHLHP